eukprot:gnl/MRDRNA2_/MRDRNA2_28437_c0_seq1.p1 gnl/MRDRNA2_/MRDRNA2_28437_c0~~gnl/MRDRNA2_/MRDRNA2_28437_c0_seq1.p1  ORF type:complete len:387 (-),score=68.19 gnl/MRDRNA2_/MRDRNA2_28437_c0_seq1:55-1215(-)
MARIDREPSLEELKMKVIKSFQEACDNGKMEMLHVNKSQDVAFARQEAHAGEDEKNNSKAIVTKIFQDALESGMLQGVLKEDTEKKAKGKQNIEIRVAKIFGQALHSGALTKILEQCRGSHGDGFVPHQHHDIQSCWSEEGISEMEAQWLAENKAQVLLVDYLRTAHKISPSRHTLRSMMGFSNDSVRAAAKNLLADQLAHGIQTNTAFTSQSLSWYNDLEGRWIFSNDPHYKKLNERWLCQAQGISATEAGKVKTQLSTCPSTSSTRPSTSASAVCTTVTTPSSPCWLQDINQEAKDDIGLKAHSDEKTRVLSSADPEPILKANIFAQPPKASGLEEKHVDEAEAESLLQSRERKADHIQNVQRTTVVKQAQPTLCSSCFPFKFH